MLKTALLFLVTVALLQVALAGLHEAAGACNNAQDLAAFKTHWDSFTTSVENCATGCVGVAGCSARCIQNANGLTAFCAACFGRSVACIMENCGWNCLSQNSPDCKQCSQQCERPLLSCSGVPKDAIPGLQ